MIDAHTNQTKITQFFSNRDLYMIGVHTNRTKLPKVSATKMIKIDMH